MLEEKPSVLPYLAKKKFFPLKTIKGAQGTLAGLTPTKKFPNR